MKKPEPKATIREYLGAFAYVLYLLGAVLIVGAGFLLFMVLVYVVGPGLLGNFILKVSRIAGPRLMYAAIGISMVVFAVWALRRMVMGTSAPLDRDQKFNRTALLLGIAAVGGALTLAGALLE